MELLVNNIPACLRELPQWVCWKSVPQPTGDPKKIPVCVATGVTASSTDRATWSTFEAAVEAYKHHRYAGIGFVFTPEDPFCGIDLDDCLDEPGRLVWGEDILTVFETYAEVSPSGFGLKLVFRATKPPKSPCNLDFRGHNIEVYDHSRFFALTGQVFEGQPTDVHERQKELQALFDSFGEKPLAAPLPPRQQVATGDRVQECLQKILAMRLEDRSDGSHRLFSAACRCVEHNLSDAEALQCLRAYEIARPFPLRRSDEQILDRVRDAERMCQRGLALAGSSAPIAPAERPSPPAVRQLVKDHPALHRPVIHGLLREGETMNVIAAPKVGKSWLVIDLAIAVATGRHWLGTFETNAAKVLILDNELHAATSANRIPKVAEARGVAFDQFADRIHVDNLRGRLRNFVDMASYFEALEPGRFGIVVCDAFYRFLPSGTDENSNADLAAIYNHLDQYAERLRCSFVLIHHASKGSQTGKSVTDVGAGAGSQSRATDTHLVLRSHEETDCAVLEAAVRSFPPIQPRVLRWTFPIWMPEDSLDPAALKPERPRRKPKPDEETEATVPKVRWTAATFVERFVTAEPKLAEVIVDEAIVSGLGEQRAEKLLRRAKSQGLAHHWRLEGGQAAFATIAQPPILALVECDSKADRVDALLAKEPGLANAEVARRCGASSGYVSKRRRKRRACA